MSVSKSAKKALEHLGMSANEIKTYTALLGMGEATAEEISEKSGVAYSKIYDALKSMENDGWVISDDSRPAKYTANSPSAGVESVKRKMEEQLTQDVSVVTTELGPLYEKTGTAEMPEILFLRGIQNIVSKITEVVDSCDNEMMIAVPEAGQEIVKQALPKLRILYDRGVKITILTSDKMDKNAIKSLSRMAKVSIKNGIYGGGIISDKRRLVILLGSEAGKMTTSDVVAIWADHAGLAGFAREYFKYLIDDSKSV